MRRSLIAVSFLLAGDALLSAALADCTCRWRGRDYDLGQSVCLSSPKGPRIATCAMVINNTSWTFSDTPCVVSTVPLGRPASASHDHKHHHGG